MLAVIVERLVDTMQSFLLCFIPLFVAIDPLGLVPVYITVTSRLEPARRRRVVLEAVPAAAVIGVVFFLAGPYVLTFLNITLNDIRIAGGAILFMYALYDLAIVGKPTVVEDDASPGLVPLATPLIVGPAVLTVGLVLVGEYGFVTPVLALLANLVILTVVLAAGERLLTVIPLNAMRALSKVIDLLLAAIGVSLVRLGVQSLIRG